MEVWRGRVDVVCFVCVGGEEGKCEEKLCLLVFLGGTRQKDPGRLKKLIFRVQKNPTRPLRP